MLKQFTGVATGSYEVEEYAQGVYLTNIKKTSTIKIERVSKSEAPELILPEMTISQLVGLNIGMAKRSALLVANAGDTEFKKVPVYFAVGGAIKLDEDIRYKITLGNITGLTVDMHKLDSSNLGFPIKVRKISIDQTNTEKVIDVIGKDLLYFPNALPTSLTHHVQSATVGRSGKRDLRKVEVLPEQITLFNDAYRLTEINAAGAYIVGNALPVYPISKIDNITVAHDGAADFDFYTVDVV